MRIRVVPVLTSLLLTLTAVTALELSSSPPASATSQIIPIPTSASGAGRIVTAPNGTIWFAEEDADKVGRIATSGQLTEIAFPAQFPGTSKIKDIAVAPDSSVWVIYESGRFVAHLDPNGTVLGSGKLDTRGNYPYGEQVRVSSDGTVWITMSYDQDFVVRIVGDTIYDDDNAPPCEGPMGLGHDGTVWCQSGNDGIEHVNSTGSGGVRYPAGNYAAWPYTIAAGPTGSIWFGRYVSKTFATPASDGEVGFLDASSGAITAYNTGARTAPSDLVQGPDGAMWFTSVGAAKGIGHVTTSGQGALTQIGGYSPAHLTFGSDGTIWATDPDNNVIIHVSTDQLQQTNVDPGAGSQLYSPQAGGVKVSKHKPVRLKHHKVPLKLICPATAPAGCAGAATLVSGRKHPKAVSKSLGYKVAAGQQTKLKLSLTKKGKKLFRRHRVVKLSVVLQVPGATPVVQTFKVRR